MKFELFLDKINQEMISNPIDHKKSIVDGCCIYVSWTKSCCVLDFSFRLPGDGVTDPVPPHWMMRSEEEGGLMWNPKTGQVYKLDEEAYNAIVELEQGYTMKQTAEKLKLKKSEIYLLEKLIQKVREAS